MSPIKQKNIDSLQIIRAAAALLVLASHASKDFIKKVPDYADDLLIWKIGQAGVDIFFVISGFIMLYVAMNTPQGMQSGVDFIKKRLIRVAPLYWIFTTLTLLVSVVTPDAKNHNDTSLLYTLSSYLFIPYERSTDDHFTPILGVGWTLNYEMMFYALFALSIIFDSTKWKTITALIAGLFLCGFFINPEDQKQLYFWTRPILMEFLMGIVIAKIYLDGRRIGNTASIALYAVGISWLIYASFATEDPTLPGVRLQAWGIPSALIVAAAILRSTTSTATHNQGFIFLKKIGDASYSLYLTHMFVIRIITIVSVDILGIRSIAILWAIVFAASIAVSIYSYKYIEVPLTAYLNKLFYSNARPTHKAA